MRGRAGGWAVESKAAGAVLALCAALPAAWVFRGFTVDDALITARVASHLADGAGYRFNIGGPIVDAVTPLGYAHLLALGGPTDVLGMLERGRALGLVSWLAAAALIGARLPRHGAARAAALLVLAVNVPLAAWASSGMETGVVTLLATLALGSGRVPALAGGMAAGLRPELLPWAVILAAGRAWLGDPDPRRRLARVLGAAALAVAPALAVAATRSWCFGSPAPLAVLAKPSDLAHGVRYAVGALVFTGIPLLVAAPRPLRAASPTVKVLVLALTVHALALCVAGGDWMSLYRLMVPVLPTALVAGAELAALSRPASVALRTVLALGVCGIVAGYIGWPARHILEQRQRLISSARPMLRGARAVATLDVGWVGAATDSDILDLAGVTDPIVARLPGGHTSKRLSEGLLESRGVDRVVLLTEGLRADDSDLPRVSRGVEARVASFAFAAEFKPRGVIPLLGTSQKYLVLAR